MSNIRITLLAIIENHRESNSSLTVSALAKAAGISRSSIYKYYPGVLELIATSKKKTSSAAKNESLKKIDFMRRQLSKNKELMSYLTNICTNQLIEISELKSALEDLERNAAAKISYLESKVAKLEKLPLRTVK